MDMLKVAGILVGIANAKMRTRLLSFAVLLCAGLFVTVAQGQTRDMSPGSWRERLHKQIPLLGHRNWILVVDSAYPLQVSPGIDTIETNADQIEVITHVLREISASKHVRPIVFEDQELSFVTDEDAPGATPYRDILKSLLNGQDVRTLPHEQILGKIDEAGRTFQVLVLKTTMTVPYTSVFVQLDCKYWSSDAEARLRKAMTKAGSK